MLQLYRFVIHLKEREREVFYHPEFTSLSPLDDFDLNRNFVQFKFTKSLDFSLLKAYYRRYNVCKRLKEDIIAEFDQTIKEEDGKFQFIRATDAFRIFRRFLFFFDPKVDKERFDIICKYIISSMFDDQSKNR